MTSVRLNGIDYRWPAQTVAVVCIDGGDPAYIERGLDDGILPNIDRFVRDGFSTIADATMPNFTCPNNMSLITGAPPSVHGISGNYHLNERGAADGDDVSHPLNAEDARRAASAPVKSQRIFEFALNGTEAAA